jgi:Domain of unknown function (DUF5063)
MDAPMNFTEAADRFGSVADRFCSIVEAASSVKRTDLIVQLYRILPVLIAQAIALPEIKSDDGDESPNSREPSANVRLSDEQWRQLYEALKEKFADWNGYTQVFDPTTDKEATFGSLADDVADIYRDLKEGLVLHQTHHGRVEDIIWEWRLLYYSHWGKHAIDALHAAHFRLQEILE